MSTIAIIAIENPDKSIVSVTLSSDGYIEHTGNILLKKYNNRRRIENVISHGAIDILGSKIGKKHDPKTPREGWTWHSDYKKQTPIPKEWCRFHHRDRGEELMIDHFKNEDELLNTYNKDSWAEFVYLYKGFKYWHVKVNSVETYSLLSEQLNYMEEIENE